MDLPEARVLEPGICIFIPHIHDRRNIHQYLDIFNSTTYSAMTLHELPHELILQIVSNIDAIRDIYHLTLVNRSLNRLLVPEIYHRHNLESDGKVLLKYAAEGNKAGIRVMLSRGADINFRPRDHYTKTALQIAIEAQDIDLVQFLLVKGALPNLPITNARYEHRPLDSAVKESDAGDLEILRLLLDHGADPNFRNSDGGTPFFKAIQLGHFDKMQLLFSRGADLSLRLPDGRTALHETIQYSRPRMAQFLLENGHEMNCVDLWNRTPLMLAAISPSLDIVTILLTAGAGVNFKSPDGKTALLVAASHGTKGNLQLLIDHGADVKVTDPNGRNALYKAVHNESTAISILNILLDNGLDIDSRDNKQLTPLLYTILKSNTNWKRDNLQTLISNGASLTSKDSSEASAMHHAAAKKLPDLIKWLGEQNAPVNELDMNGETPIFWALTWKDMERAPATIEALLALGADSNPVNHRGQTPLFLAARLWCPRSTSVFLVRGADVNHKDKEGMTPLHWFAASQETPRNKDPFGVLELLISLGADVNAETDKGATPLSLIRNRHTTKYIRRVLIDAGARE